MSQPPDSPGEPPAPARGRGAQPGHFGNQPFVPTAEQRERARTLAKTFPVHGEHYIARLLGISRMTLRTHFADDLELGRAEMLASVGAQMINRAINAEGETIKGDIDAQKFILARMGGWTTKVEVGEKGARPFGGGPAPDLSRLNKEELDEYGRLSAIAEGLDPDEVVDGGADD